MALVYCATSVARSLPPPEWGNFVVQTDEALSLSVCVCILVAPLVSLAHSANICTVLARIVAWLLPHATHTHDALLITWLIAAHNGRAVNLSLFVCVPCVCVCLLLWLLARAHVCACNRGGHIGHVWVAFLFACLWQRLMHMFYQQISPAIAIALKSSSLHTHRHR